ncbi:hypothetical protein H8A97_12935 [Bradyrhizobium sp. Arg62]|uniref:hypothetical protein n=1 Tax=Bradyrhizobium brasilense TaxID=1419277 RepID=UPI001E542A9E|nr:hypothetical protein [Bradyrhizobium brasilense]MCC8945978.1 hypothetical protein [Bradyrhizobium brasilense]
MDILDMQATLSQLSPADHAELLARIEDDGDADLRGYVIEALGWGTAQPAHITRESAREVPPQWTQIHVLDRLEEAFAVLSSLPARTRPKQFGNGMPTPVREKLTNKDWIDLLEAGELEKVEEQANRVRLAPTTAQITRMDQALRWPFEHLAGEPELARALSRRAMWAAMKVDIRKRCEQRQMQHELFQLQWQHGLRLVTERLIMARVAVS